MPSNIERRLDTLESLRKRHPSQMTDAELLELIHGRRLTPEEAEDYMRKLEAKAEANHAINKH